MMVQLYMENLKNKKSDHVQIDMTICCSVTNSMFVCYK